MILKLSVILVSKIPESELFKGASILNRKTPLKVNLNSIVESCLKLVNLNTNPIFKFTILHFFLIFWLKNLDLKNIAETFKRLKDNETDEERSHNKESSYTESKGDFTVALSTWCHRFGKSSLGKFVDPQLILIKLKC